MILADLSFDTSTSLLATAVVLGCAALAAVAVRYLSAASSAAVRVTAALLKLLAFAALLACLLEPTWSGIRPRPGANVFVVVADNSQSIQVRDRGAEETRGEQLKRLLTQTSGWQTRLGQSFDVRRYAFDTRLHAVADFAKLDFDRDGSSLGATLQTIARRYQGRPTAGVLLFTDGNATDLDESAFDAGGLPPVYPVLLGETAAARDISVRRVSVSQTNFEAAPVTVLAEIVARGIDRQPVLVQLLDEATGQQLQQQLVNDVQDGEPFTLRFQLQPERSGVSFYRLRALADSEQSLFAEPTASEQSQEATLANNSRLVLVDRGGGPYRVLYVSGRPNWEFKFLRRSAEKDAEVNLVGLVRIARREPKFDFRSRRGESTNPLFRGFGNESDLAAEQYDEPVLLRLGTRDAEELQGGFPKSADVLYEYDAVILDDLEAEFFTQDQMLLLQKFVSQRGGGLLMLGGAESFSEGGYHRTPIGELLPVYLDRLPEAPPDRWYRVALTQEGWLEPWVRVRPTETDEQKRLDAMPDFETFNRAHGVKPGAVVLAKAFESNGDPRPALVTQRFGKGRASALLIGDLWRWSLERPESERQRDLEKSWRQTLRWLVADVPRRVEVHTRRVPNDPNQAVELEVRARDATYEPLDNASVTIRVTGPQAAVLELRAEAGDEAGVYRTTCVPRQPGAYRVEAAVTGPDGGDAGRREAGFTAEPALAEFQRLEPNRGLLERLAAETGGAVIGLNELDAFVASLPDRQIPITERWTFPLWHHWGMLTFVAVCLCCEWGLRRWKGLA